MSDAELERLEREIEAARARVAVDLARLREPGAFAELKEDITEHVSRTKDQLLDSAKESVRNRSESLMAEVMARVAANPGAALAVGAGLAWRLYRHPPVASLLVGAGLYGLARTDPHHPAMGAGAAARAAELAETARSRTEEWRHRDIAGRIGDRAAEARQRVGELADSAGERLGSLADAARERLGAAAEAAREQVSGRHGGNGVSRRSAAPRSWPVGEMPVRKTGWAPEQQRDQYLLGAAALAMAAAVGLAAQRRFSQEDTADASVPPSRLSDRDETQLP
ncbi:MAG TPA: hypothetical protein VHG92_04355 [Afifellaceae bacterium]|nr:hypothetical protein [Afifellaceae bacterium]